MAGRRGPPQRRGPPRRRYPPTQLPPSREFPGESLKEPEQGLIPFSPLTEEARSSDVEESESSRFRCDVAPRVP